MAYFAGLDVSVKETSVCIVDDAGKIIREVRVASEPGALLQVLANNIYRCFVTIGPDRFCEWNLPFVHQAGFRRAFL